MTERVEESKLAGQGRGRVGERGPKVVRGVHSTRRDVVLGLEDDRERLRCRTTCPVLT